MQHDENNSGMNNSGSQQDNPDSGGQGKYGSGPGFTSPTGYLHQQSWAERNGFPPWLLALVWVVLGFVLFQLAGNTMAAIYLITAADDAVTAFDVELLMEHIDVLFITNSISQILFLGLMTWLITGLVTTGKRSAFLRFRTDGRTLPVVLLTVVLVIVMQPVIWLFSWLNAQIPMWDGYMAMEETQMEMIKGFLTADHITLIALFHVGLVPSICEEILFRGYAQRLMEKSWGIWAAIIVGGLLFGLFHIRLTQLIPLTLIGMLLAWLVWRSDSIYPAITGHFVNNGGSVLVASLYSDYALEQMTATELPPVWLLLVSAGVTIMVIRYIHHITERE